MSGTPIGGHDPSREQPRRSGKASHVSNDKKDPHHDRRWKILGVIAIAQLMVVLDVTIVNIALPSAQADLGFDDDSRQWVITAYALAFGSLLLLGGKISDLVGRKWTFIAGLGGFAGASALGGAASSFEVLVAARALQGAFAALLAPAALSIVTTTFTDPVERGKAFGVYGALATAGAALGLLLGGFLTELLTWRWTMYVNLAFAIPAAIGAARLLVNMRPAVRPKIDVPGVLVASSGLFALVYGFANAEMDSWSAPLTVGLLAYGVAAAVAFVAIERRVASAAAAAAGGQRSQPRRGVPGGVDRRRRDVRDVPVPDLLPAAEPGLLADRVRPGLPADGGRGLGDGSGRGDEAPAARGPAPARPDRDGDRGAGLVYLTGIDVDSSYAAAVLPGRHRHGSRLRADHGSRHSRPRPTASQPDDAGVASAMVNTSQQVGGSLGVALLSTHVRRRGQRLHGGDRNAGGPGAGRGGRPRLHHRVLVGGGHPGGRCRS